MRHCLNLSLATTHTYIIMILWKVQRFLHKSTDPASYFIESYVTILFVECHGNEAFRFERQIITRYQIQGLIATCHCHISSRRQDKERRKERFLC